MPSATSRPAQALCRAETLRTSQPLVRLAGWPPRHAGVVLHDDRVEGHVAGAAGERRGQTAPAVEHRTRLATEGVAGFRLTLKLSRGCRP